MNLFLFSRVWNALTDNYGNVMAVDWKTSHTRSLHLPTLNITEHEVHTHSHCTGYNSIILHWFWTLQKKSQDSTAPLPSICLTTCLLSHPSCLSLSLFVCLSPPCPTDRSWITSLWICLMTRSSGSRWICTRSSSPASTMSRSSQPNR